MNPAKKTDRESRVVHNRKNSETKKQNTKMQTRSFAPKVYEYKRFDIVYRLIFTLSFI